MALVLTLKDGEFIFLGPSVTISVKRHRSKETRVYIEAPKDVFISTSNYHRKQQKKEQAP